MMFRPGFLESEEFKVWQERARTKRDELLRAENPKSSFDARVWQDFKNDVLIPLVGQCAYCEGRYAAGGFCDAEHYRPKNEVTEAREPVSHPGYFWLAYEWYNLLLACRKCNSAHRDLDHAKRLSHPGKLCEFPIENGSRRVTAPSPMPDNSPPIL